MVALGTAAPDGSVTVPTMVASCARAETVKSAQIAARIRTVRVAQRRIAKPKLPASVGERDFIEASKIGS
jgi:hypothetical protein